MTEEITMAANPHPSNPLPHTPLNHFLKSTKSLLASGGLDNEDAVYVITSPEPTLDQIVAALVFSFFQQNLQANKQTQFRYVPVISSSRSICLEQQVPELTLALQTALVAEENLIFEDEMAYKAVSAYTSKRKVVLVGGSTERKGLQAWNDWQDLHGAQLFGFIDVESTLPQEIHDEEGGVNEKLPVAIFPSTHARGSGDSEPSLTSLVALWTKAQLQEVESSEEKQVKLAHESVPQEVADLCLAAIVLETDNLSESRTNPADLGAVGWLNPISSFQNQNQDQATAPVNDDHEGDKGHAESEEAALSTDQDPYVPTFPDLDSLHRALRSASKRNISASQQASLPSTIPSSLGDSSPTHFQWNLITNTLADKSEEEKAKVPAYVKQTIEGDFASLLTSKSASTLLQPIGAALGRAVTAENDSLDLFQLQPQLTEVVGTLLHSDADEAGFEILCLAISALHAFVQVNWTGPDLPDSLHPYNLLRSAAPDAFPPRSVDVEEDQKAEQRARGMIKRAALDALAFKGEPAYHLCQVPFFLIFSKLLLEALWSLSQQKQQQTRSNGETRTAKLEMETLAWWRLRAFTVQSHVLDEPVAFGKKVFDPVDQLKSLLEARSVANQPATETDVGKSAWAALAARLTLERGIALQRLGSDREASETFVEAAKNNGLRYRMSGALGKRTKFQKEDKTQLVLLAKSVVADGGKEDEDEGEKNGGVAAQQQEQQEESEGKEELPATDAELEKAQMETGFMAKANPEDQVAGMPSTYALNDDTLLEQTKFTSTAAAGSATSSSQQNTGNDDDLLQLDPNSQPALAVLDQCILLALCLNIRNTQAAHGLTANQMQIFISRVITHPRNWMVHTMSLLLRARLEATRTRTVERSVLQLQALIDQMPTNDSSIQERLKFFHALDLPPKWEMQAELARRYASIGVTRSALEIFERIEMWEDVVACLGMLGRQQEGVEVVRELLEGKKVEADVEVSTRRRKALVSGSKTSEAQTVMFGRMDRAREAKLWCLLGDLEPESSLSHYSKAWQVSSSSSSRAARSLGGVHFARQNYAEAAKWLKNGLKINPLFTRSWFILGCCYMRLEKWKDAAQCFRRCTALDDEDAESWNNLASCYLRMVEDAGTTAGSDAVGIERMGMQGGMPDIMEAEEEADRVWDANQDGDAEEGMSEWSGSSRSDSGVELSGSDTETETETESTSGTEVAGLPDPGQPTRTSSRLERQQTADNRATTAYTLKLLAHRSLKNSLRFAHDNWRVWFNYMITCVDIGFLFEATRAMVRVTEIQTKSLSTEREKAKSVDLAVLARLVDAVTRTPRAELEEEALSGVEAYEDSNKPEEGPRKHREDEPKLDPNSGLGLYPAVRRLFDETLLTRISSSPEIWKFYSRLLTWKGERRRAVQYALLNAYNSALNGALQGEDGDLTTDKHVFVSLLHDLRNLVDGLLTLPTEEDAEAVEGGTNNNVNPRFRARSLVRTFLAKTRTSWDQEPEYEEAQELLEELKN